MAWSADYNLREELRYEKWERSPHDGNDWSLHGSYSDAEIDDIVSEMTEFWIMIAVPLVLGALGIGYYLAHKSTAPARDINRQLASIHLDSLERRVDPGTADPDYQELARHLNDLLARLHESFEHYREHSTHVAHELRTPIHLLRLQLENAASSLPPELAESLQNELLRLGQLVDGLLTAARAEHGHIDPQVIPLDWDPFITDFLESYQLLAAEVGRVLLIDTRHGHGMTVRVDPAHLRQILHNLLDNALKYGSGPVRIRTRHTANATFQVVVANRTTAERPSPGMGIGLRLARALAVLQPEGQLRIRRGPDYFVARVEFAVESR
jgi:two-component system heavy metal sensor histidine kinase CusS